MAINKVRMPNMQTRLIVKYYNFIISPFHYINYYTVNGKLDNKINLKLMDIF